VAPRLGNNDDTVIQRPPPARLGRRRWPFVLGVGLLLAVAGAGGGLALNWWPAAPPAPPPIATATEAAIDAELPGDPKTVRFALNPTILVFDFASLAQQGAMLNRVAALVEKAGMPRDRVLTDAELASAVLASGATPETYYYGHDYRVADIARFFELADRDHVALDPDEELLRQTLAGQGLLKPGAVGALISIPALGSDQLVDAQARATILHHELAHGEYFTVPAYADYTRHFWQDALTEQDRASFRKFLADDGYDDRNEDLMMNEMQAYLMHTRDPRFFSAKAVGIPEERLRWLQAQFLLGMPAGWLRDCTPGPAK